MNCSSCDGTGNCLSACYVCGGTGLGREGRIACLACHGRRFQKCGSCNGTGRSSLREGPSAPAGRDFGGGNLGHALGRGTSGALGGGVVALLAIAGFVVVVIAALGGRNERNENQQQVKGDGGRANQGKAHLPAGNGVPNKAPENVPNKEAARPDPPPPPTPPVDRDYPEPVSRHEGMTAPEWWAIAVEKPGDAHTTKALDALKAVKAEGIPFLLDLLDRTTEGTKRLRIFNRTDVSLIHAKDVERLVTLLADPWTRPPFITAIPRMGKKAASILPQLETELETSRDNVDRAMLQRAIATIK